MDIQEGAEVGLSWIEFLHRFQREYHSVLGHIVHLVESEAHFSSKGCGHMLDIG
jgi:hypothetical protein